MKLMRKLKTNNFRNGKILFVLIMVLLFVTVFLYSDFNGDRMIAHNESVNRWLLDQGQKIPGFNHWFKDPEIVKYLPDNYGYAEKLENMNAFTEHATHVVLFFVFTLGFLYALKWTRLSFWQKIAVAVFTALVLNYGSEMYQNGIHHRGYEDIDIFHNFWGMVSAVIVFSLYVYFKYGPKKTVKEKSSGPKKIEIRYITGESFFKDQ